jgi:hypothetical protein
MNRVAWCAISIAGVAGLCGSPATAQAPITTFPAPGASINDAGREGQRGQICRALDLLRCLAMREATDWPTLGGAHGNLEKLKADDLIRVGGAPCDAGAAVAPATSDSPTWPPDESQTSQWDGFTHTAIVVNEAYFSGTGGGTTWGSSIPAAADAITAGALAHEESHQNDTYTLGPVGPNQTPAQRNSNLLRLYNQEVEGAQVEKKVLLAAIEKLLDQPNGSVVHARALADMWDRRDRMCRFLNDQKNNADALRAAGVTP